MCIGEHQIDGIRTQQIRSFSHGISKMASESPTLQPVRQEMGIMKTLADQEHVSPGEFHLSPSKF
jgi:hypothetical protein